MSTNAELRALAEKATPGRWEADHLPLQNGTKIAGIIRHIATEDGPGLEWFIHFDNIRNEDGEYIAAVNPARIIELLDEHRQAVVDSAAAQTEMFGFRNEAAALRAKLDLAVRALDNINTSPPTFSVNKFRLMARDALAQLK